MIVHRFLDWVDSATSAQRAEAAVLLAEGHACGRYPEDDRSLAELCMMVLAKDRSSAVRAALAETLADLDDAPRAILVLLMRDAPSVALPIAARSRTLREDDLIDLAASGSERVQSAIAGRQGVSVGLSAAIAEVAGADACATLLVNETASILDRSLDRITERHGREPAVREAFLRRSNCPSRIRQALAEALAVDLRGSDFVAAVLGPKRADAILTDAQESAIAAIAAGADGFERHRYLGHLKDNGRINLGFLCRTLASGDPELFKATLIALSPLSAQRVESILATRRDGALRSLLTGCGIDPALAPLVTAFLERWSLHASDCRRFGTDCLTPVVVGEALSDFEQRSDATGLASVLDHLRRLAADAELRDANARVALLAA